MENCQRCLKNKSSFQCRECSSFNVLCTRCDKIIHNIPTKQNHRRILLSQPLTNREIKDDLNQIALSNIELENEMINQSNIEQNNNLLISTNAEEKNPKKEITNNVSIFNSNLLIKDKYSKEYVNEIKKIFKKEKSFLEYKNKSLQSSLDKIKLEFTDQINNITKQLEEIQSTNILNITSLKDNYEKKIYELNLTHEEEVKNYSANINQLENELNTVKENYNKEMDEKNSIINELKNENERLNVELKIKKEENTKIKNSLEIMSKQYEKEFFEEKNKIINEYELKIESIVTNVENTKNNLVNLVEQREFDLKNFLDEKNTEIFKLNEINKKMKQELESHKINLVNIKNNKENLFKENQELKNEINKLNCDTQLQLNEIIRIQQENQNLYEENNQLKQELNKLDNIIYSNNNN